MINSTHLKKKRIVLFVCILHIVFFFLSFNFLLLQILGMGTKRLLTLTHRAQVKRFTQDLLKLLKFQASKQVSIKDFMQAYHWSVNIAWSCR